MKATARKLHPLSGRLFRRPCHHQVPGKGQLLPGKEYKENCIWVRCKTFRWAPVPSWCSWALPGNALCTRLATTTGQSRDRPPWEGATRPLEIPNPWGFTAQGVPKTKVEIQCKSLLPWVEYQLKSITVDFTVRNNSMESLLYSLCWECGKMRWNRKHCGTIAKWKLTATHYGHPWTQGWWNPNTTPYCWTPFHLHT